MNADDLMDACAGLPAAQLDHPFGPETAVFKVVGKIFAIVSAESTPPTATLKADPEDARALVATYPEVTPGYHMNKRHWITLTLPAPQVPVAELIRDSYDLVVAGLPRASRPTRSALQKGAP